MVTEVYQGDRHSLHRILTLRLIIDMFTCLRYTKPASITVHWCLHDDPIFIAVRCSIESLSLLNM